jgi:hypothetical protein
MMNYLLKLKTLDFRYQTKDKNLKLIKYPMINNQYSMTNIQYRSTT